MLKTINQQLQNQPVNFNSLDLEALAKELEGLLLSSEEFIQKLLQQTQFSWETLVQPLEEMNEVIQQKWGLIGHLHSVVNSEDLRKIYESLLPKITAFYNALSQNAALFHAYEGLQKSPDYENLSTAQKTIMTHDLRNFKLAGVALSAKDKEKFKALAARLSEVENHYEQNVMDATDSWQLHIVEPKELEGLPERVLESARLRAKEKDQPGYLFSLHYPDYSAVMTYGAYRDLRRRFSESYHTRASSLSAWHKTSDNAPLILEILKIRAEIAQLVGFKNYAELSLATKMATDVSTVITFLQDLVQRCKKHGEKELAELQDFVLSLKGPEKLEPWDIGYYSEKMSQARFGISQEELRPYFPLDKVLKGLFELAQQLYGLTISPRSDLQGWHVDVSAYEIRDQAQVTRGVFYIDLFARAKKRGGAWMNDAKARFITSAGITQSPVAYIVANFAEPQAQQSALLNHDDVVTLFHEFGHCLHHLLSQVDYASASGIHGVAWDAVELPSQFMENWCWEPEVINKISSHIETHEPLPAALFDKLLASKHFQSGLRLLRQLELSLFDFLMHEHQPFETESSVQEFLNHIRKEVAVIPAAAFNRFQNSFTHIFGGGYAAGYYSYLWAEVLSADAFSRFKEEGILNSSVGQEFLAAILEQGGSEEPLILFKKFRGRAPTIDAFLKDKGL